MEESYVEGVAGHNGPESCGGARKGVVEALTGVRAGRVFSREIHQTPVCRRRKEMRKATPGASPSQDAPESRAVADPVHVRKHLAREPGDPAFARPRHRGRPHREVFGHTPMMHERGKSDGSIVPAKPPNNSGGTRLDPGRPKSSPAEEAEGRGPAKGNRREIRTLRTQCRNNGCTRFSRRYGGRDVMSVLSCPSVRHYPRQDPDAVIPPVRICAGACRKARPYRDQKGVNCWPARGLTHSTRKARRRARRPLLPLPVGCSCETVAWRTLIVWP